MPETPPPTFFGWSGPRRLALAAAALVPLWLAVGWALNWWGR